MVLVPLLRSPVINAIRNNLPPDIPVGHFPLVEGRARCEGKQDGTDDIELVVDIPRVVEALGRKGALKTGISHPKGHRVHVYVAWIGLTQAQLGRRGVLILEDRDVYLHGGSSPHPDVPGQRPEARVVSDVIVVDILALRDGVVEGQLRVPDPEEGDDGDGEGDSGLGGQGFVLVADGGDDLVEITVGVVGLVGDHLEHPRTVLEHQWETKVLVLLGNVLLAELQLALLVHLQEVPLDLLAPLDLSRARWLGPLGVKPQPVEELFDAEDLELLLLLLGLLEVLNWS